VIPLKEKIYLSLLSMLLLISCSRNEVSTVYTSKKNYLPDVKSEYFLTDEKFAGNTKVQNFSKAKSIIKKMNFFGIKEELYCGCEFHNGKISSDAKCGIQSRRNPKRAFRIEFEHIVPFENQVGHTYVWDFGIPECHGDKGRKCASKIFGHLEGDLWNLWPSAGELNADRSNYSYAMLPGPRDQYGKCDFKVEDRKAAPRDEVKALVAFTYMYFQKTYAQFLGTNFISNKNEKLFEAWSKYPLTREQCNWGREVEKIQGNRNVDFLNACEFQNK
jgi:deoxyribonuclease-1